MFDLLGYSNDLDATDSVLVYQEKLKNASRKRQEPTQQKKRGATPKSCAPYRAATSEA
jgi:uncharacterized protein YihD (DUF1040 family)